MLQFTSFHVAVNLSCSKLAVSEAKIHANVHSHILMFSPNASTSTRTHAERVPAICIHLRIVHLTSNVCTKTYSIDREDQHTLSMTRKDAWYEYRRAHTYSHIHKHINTQHIQNLTLLSSQTVIEPVHANGTARQQCFTQPYIIHTLRHYVGIAILCVCVCVCVCLYECVCVCACLFEEKKRKNAK